MVAQLQIVPQTNNLPAIEVSRGTLSAREAEVQAIFEFWRTLLSTTRSRLDATRRKKITERLRDGYSADDVKRAIIGCALSDWHRGANDRGTRYQGIELICRDASHMDKFLEIADREEQRIMAERDKQAQAAERASAEAQPASADTLSTFRDILDQLKRRNAR